LFFRSFQFSIFYLLFLFILDVRYAIEILQILKKLSQKGYIPAGLVSKIKSIVFSNSYHPLHDQIISLLDQCSKDKWYRGCAENIKKLIYEDQFSFSGDVLDILLADENSNHVQSMKRLVNLRKNLNRYQYSKPQDVINDVHTLIKTQAKSSPSPQIESIENKFEELVEFIR